MPPKKSIPAVPVPPASVKPKAKLAATNPRRKGQRVQAKPPKLTAEKLKHLFASLCAQIDDGHFKNGIKTCDKILRHAPNDQDAFQTKLFLLLQTDQYKAALDLIVAGSESNPGLDYEKAYVLYRLHKETDARALIEELSSKAGEELEEKGLRHLDAQLNYREGKYEETKDIYDQILNSDTLDLEEQNDILTNLSAAQSHLDFFTSGFLTALYQSSVPIGQLEDTPPPAAPTHQQPSSSSTLPSTTTKQSASGQPAAATAEIIAPKPPRKRRVPKHVVLGVTPLPDPERWIKKRERVHVTFGGRKWKGKGKKREGMTAGHSQGASVAPAVGGVMESSGGQSGGSGVGKGKRRK